jgi:hypothetical protein
MTYTDPAEKTAMARHSFAARASVVQAKAAKRHLRAGRQSPVARAADRFIAGLKADGVRDSLITSWTPWAGHIKENGVEVKL